MNAMKIIDFPKILFFLTCIISITACSVVQVYEERSKIKPKHWIRPAPYDGDGVTVNNIPEDRQELILLQGFFDNNPELRLIQRNGAVVARWPVRYSDLATDITHVRNQPATDWNVGSMGAVALPDGSVVFILDHIGVFKLDRCGNLVWRVDIPAHHSLEWNADGSFWVSSANNFYADMESPSSLFKTPFAADTLVRISQKGEVLDSISLLEVFENSNKRALLALMGIEIEPTSGALRPDFDREIFHLNDVEELPAAIAEDFPMFEAGDLLVSLRNRNLVLVIGHERKIKWWQIGPWIKQHDPDWKPGGMITVFDNNTGDRPAGSRIIEINPATSEVRLVYGGRDTEFFYSGWGGKHQNLYPDRVLITETASGRVFEVNTNKEIVWEYVNRYSDTESAIISQANTYSSDYFSVADWSCPTE